MLRTDAAFYVVTSQMKWGRGLTIPFAFKAAGNVSAKDNKVAWEVVCILFKKGESEEIKERILKLYVVSGLGGVVIADDCTKEERKLIKDHVVGYLTFDNEKEYTAYKEKQLKKRKQAV